MGSSQPHVQKGSPAERWAFICLITWDLWVHISGRALTKAVTEVRGAFPQAGTKLPFERSPSPSLLCGYVRLSWESRPSTQCGCGFRVDVGAGAHSPLALFVTGSTSWPAVCRGVRAPVHLEETCTAQSLQGQVYPLLKLELEIMNLQNDTNTV